jgi:hypothetical protein
VWESIIGRSAYPRRISGRLCLALLLAALLAPTAADAAAPKPRPSTVFVIVLENREYGEVKGNWEEMPYFNRLVERGAVTTNFYAAVHPSLPNYLALLGGSTFGVTTNCTDCLVYGQNLATQLSRAGISWRAYMEGLPYPCYTGGDVGYYGKRHNPFVYFPSITALPKRCANVVPSTRLEEDLAARKLPRFAWLTPDGCHDAHDCSLATADFYLSTLVPQITRQLGPRGLLIITWDEGFSDLGCCGAPGGGKIATVLVGPKVPRGKDIRMVANHYSLLASLEDYFGLPRLREARTAEPLAPSLFEPTE